MPTRTACSSEFLGKERNNPISALRNRWLRGVAGQSAPARRVSSFGGRLLLFGIVLKSHEPRDGFIGARVSISESSLWLLSLQRESNIHDSSLSSSLFKEKGQRSLEEGTSFPASL
jgi:hypothetical protein